MAWDHADTATAYERFCRKHRRYRDANEALVRRASLAPGQRVLDVAAGTGRTAEVVLPHVGDDGTVLCVEPADAMRSAGKARLADPRVTWTHDLPLELSAHFDRVICSAAIWQMSPFETTVRVLSALVSPGGALVFNIPAMYALEPDAPGTGRDPFLTDLPRLVDRSGVTTDVLAAPARVNPGAVLSANDIDAIIHAAGLRFERWTFRLRLTQAAYRDWLKIPPVSEGLFPGLSAAERARRLDEAYQQSSRRSWRWERWLGWTAWRPGAA
jgi:SAM-dependent methyltransferase